MKKYFSIFMLLLLLTACHGEPAVSAPVPTSTPAATVTPAPTPTSTPESTPTPTPEPTAPGLELDVGDGEHKFWVELTGEGTDRRVNIYEKQGDSQPLQTFLEEGNVPLDTVELTAEDVNFDGFMDFHFYTGFGYSTVSHSSYYTWDPEEGCFVPDPYGLNELSTAEFLPDTKEVSSLSRRPQGTGITSNRYEDGKLVQVGERFCPEEDSDVKAYTARKIEVDEDHAFWVEVVDTGEPAADCNKLLVNIYRDEAKEELFQTFESWWAAPYGLYCFPVEDMDFDGDMDFAVCNIEYRSNHQRSHYIWDGAQEKFVEDPYGLNDLNHPHFDGERQVVRANWGDVTGETRNYYEYREGALVCIRSLCHQYWSEDNAVYLKAEDEVDGALTTVYEEKIPFGELPEGELWTEEFERWSDLDYHGES